MEIPECCYECKNFENEYNEYSDTNYFYCVLNIIFPIKKKTCKKMKTNRP